MLSSNQPYQRVDDGIGAGLIAGSVIGGAAAGATQMWGKEGINKIRGLSDGALNKAQKAVSNIGPQAGIGDMTKAANNFNTVKTRHEKMGSVLDGAEKWRGKGFSGGWKGKSIAYGGSVLAGGLIGAAID